ncbi:MAG: hypothetical protein AB7S46_05285 [Flavobacteriaceae bacterium]
MTIGNMREHGVRRLDIQCRECHHRVIRSADGLSDDIEIPAYGARLRCSACGSRNIDCRPNWMEHVAHGNGGRAAE